MNSVLVYVLFGIMAVMGGGSSIVVLVGIPAVILWKIYRKIRFGKAIF